MGRGAASPQAAMRPERNTLTTANEQAITRAYEAFGTGDMQAIRDESFAADIHWTWPGTGPLSGVYTDIDGVLGMFGKLVEGSKGTFKVAPESIKGYGDFVVVCSRASWTDASGSHDDPYIQTFRMKDGRAAECNIHFTDIKLWDAFPA
jgi:ketosteroid isomerase-like protein